MRKLVVVFAVLLCSVSSWGQKYRYGQGLPSVKPGVDYPIVMHIYGVHLRPYCALPRSSWESCGDVFYADVIVHGSKFELRTDSDREQDPYHPWTLTLGDYHARAVKGVAGEVQLHIGDEYDLVLPHQKVLRCVVSGLME